MIFHKEFVSLCVIIGSVPHTARLLLREVPEPNIPKHCVRTLCTKCSLVEVKDLVEPTNAVGDYL